MVRSYTECVFIYSTAKETKKFTIKKGICSFQKYILHVKLAVYFTVSFAGNIYFMNSTYFYFQSI